MAGEKNFCRAERFSYPKPMFDRSKFYTVSWLSGQSSILVFVSLYFKVYFENFETEEEFD